MSASICRSHWSAANSSNHSRKRANSPEERCETADSRSSRLMHRKLSTKRGIANRCPAQALTLRSSLLKGEQRYWGALAIDRFYRRSARQVDRSRKRIEFSRRVAEGWPPIFRILRVG